MKLDCPECKAPMTLRTSVYGLFYGCTRYPDCDGAHGAARDGSPLGTPATKEVKKARIAAHAAFDTLWKGRIMSRDDAYAWLATAMELPRKDAHIGRFDKPQCEKLIALVATRSSTSRE